MDKSTWEWLKSKRIDASTRNSAKTLYAYGSTNPLPTVGTFTANVVVRDTDKSCVAILLLLMLRAIICWAETLLEIWGCWTLGR